MTNAICVSIALVTFWIGYFQHNPITFNVCTAISAFVLGMGFALGLKFDKN